MVKPTLTDAWSFDRDALLRLRDDQLIARVYAYLINQVLGVLVPTTGQQMLSDILQGCVENHPILKMCQIKEDGILSITLLLEDMIEHQGEEGIQKTLLAFSDLISKYIDRYTAIASTQITNQILSNAYQKIRDTLMDVDVPLCILESMPQGYLEQEKLSLLSKQDLEIKVKERTSELDAALKKADQAINELEKSRASFYNIVEKSTDGIIVVDLQGKVKFINQTAASYLGRNSSELKGNSIDIPLDQDKTPELNIILPDKSRGIAELRIVETAWQDKRAYLALLRDITKRKQAEQALLDSEQELLGIFNGVSDGIAIIDNTGRLTRINKRIIDVGGYPEKAVIGKRFKFLRMFPQRSIATMVANFAKLLAGKPIPTFEVEVSTKAGKKLDVEMRGSVLRKGGKVAGMIGVMRDITDRKRAEIALIESEEEFRAIFDGVVDGIALLDLTGKIVRINKRILDVSGYSEQEIIGSRFQILKMFTPGSLAKMGSLFPKIISGQEISPIEITGHAKSGRKYVLELWSSLFKKSGKTIGILAVMRDITNRIEAEEKLKESLSEKEMLLREIHHRVKNNLQIVTSLLSLQSKSVEDENTKDILHEIQGRIYSMATIHEVLYQTEDLAKIEFDDYIQKLTKHLFKSYAINPDKIGLKLELENISLSIDSTICCGMIINELVSNSLKYAFPANQQGVIKISAKTTPGDKKVLIVSDNGIGLPSQVCLQELDTLGLKLVRILAEQINAELEYDRTDGTKVTISFEE